MTIEVNVSGAYPCWVSFEVRGETVLRMTHTELLEWEHAISLAKQKCLFKLPLAFFHEVDQAYAKQTP